MADHLALAVARSIAVSAEAYFALHSTTVNAMYLSEDDLRNATIDGCIDLVEIAEEVIALVRGSDSPKPSE